MENKARHLEMIQGIINRLSTNSFLLKGWSVILVSALFALSAHNASMNFIYLALFPAVFFWGLDGYFLWEERKFRALFDRIRLLPENEIDFSMDRSYSETRSWFSAVFSKTLIPFHGVLILAILAVMLITKSVEIPNGT